MFLFDLKWLTRPTVKLKAIRISYSESYFFVPNATQGAAAGVARANALASGRGTLNATVASERGIHFRHLAKTVPGVTVSGSAEFAYDAYQQQPDITII